MKSIWLRFIENIKYHVCWYAIMFIGSYRIAVFNWSISPLILIKITINSILINIKAEYMFQQSAFITFKLV